MCVRAWIFGNRILCIIIIHDRSGRRNVYIPNAIILLLSLYFSTAYIFRREPPLGLIDYTAHLSIVHTHILH